jgi:hypothetical protein
VVLDELKNGKISHIWQIKANLIFKSEYKNTIYNDISDILVPSRGKMTKTMAKAWIKATPDVVIPSGRRNYILQKIEIIEFFEVKF